MVRSGRARLKSLAAIAILLLGPILSACSSPTIDVAAKITSPAPNSSVKVGEQIQIEGLVTGEGITQVDVLINNSSYAQLTVPDKDKSVGVSNFPIAAGQVPWTPQTPGLYALQLIVYKAPQNELLKKSEPVLITAVPVGDQMTATPAQGAQPVPTAPQAVAPAAPAAPGTAATLAPPAAGGNAAAGGPSMTVVNDFVNVRKGPGVGYDKIGQLNKGQSAPVKGKSNDGEWLQITFSGASNGVGWVKQRDGSDALVQTNDAAKNVAVAAAPPLPTSEPVAAPVAPAAPSGNVQIVPLQPAAPTAPVAALPTAVPQGSLTGAGGIIRLSANPVGSGGSTTALWNIPNFREGEFDKGDGRGFIGPINGQMDVLVTGITSARTVTVRWRDTSGTQKQDSITIQVLGSAAVVATTASNSDCNANNPQWRGSNPAFTFCSASDLFLEQPVGSIADFATGQDYTLTARWNIYGINGIHFIVEPSGFCGPAGTTGGINRASTGTGPESFNVNTLSYGGWKINLEIIRRDGGVVRYNEKILCIGNRNSSAPTKTNTPVGVPTATQTPAPLPIDTPVPPAATPPPPSIAPPATDIP